MGMRINTKIPVESYNDLRKSIRQLYIQLPSWISSLSNSNVDYPTIGSMYSHIKNAGAQWATIVAESDVPALRTYAQSQHSDPTFDPAAQYTALVAANSAVTDWMKANLTTNAGLDEPPLFLTPAQSAPLVALMQTLKGACE